MEKLDSSPGCFIGLCSWTKHQSFSVCLRPRGEMGSGNLTKCKEGGREEWVGRAGSREMGNNASLSASLHLGVGMGTNGLSEKLDLICSELTLHQWQNSSSLHAAGNRRSSGSYWIRSRLRICPKA